LRIRCCHLRWLGALIVLVAITNASSTFGQFTALPENSVDVPLNHDSKVGLRLAAAQCGKACLTVATQSFSQARPAVRGVASNYPSEFSERQAFPHCGAAEPPCFRDSITFEAKLQFTQNTLSAQSNATDPNRHVVIISGASGEPAYAKQFQQWTSSLQAVLLERFGFPKNRVKLLVEKPTDPTVAPATADEVKKLFASLRTELNPDSVLFVFLIGHGSFDKEAKFNLVGPDLSASEYNNLLSALPTQRIVIFNMASASGEFIKPLAARGRVIVTATSSGQENNAVRFMEYFLAALKANDADADQDGHISVLEAFNYANRLTAEFYTRAGRLATEHALLEDNGDGVGHTKMEGGDGLLARATYLDSLTVSQAAANATVAKLMRDRTRLESEIAQLIGSKSSMPEADYEKELERLFIELAKVNRSIKQGSNASVE